MDDLEQKQIKIVILYSGIARWVQAALGDNTQEADTTSSQIFKISVFLK